MIRMHVKILVNKNFANDCSCGNNRNIHISYGLQIIIGSKQMKFSFSLIFEYNKSATELL